MNCMLNRHDVRLNNFSAVCKKLVCVIYENMSAKLVNEDLVKDWVLVDNIYTLFLYKCVHNQSHKQITNSVHLISNQIVPLEDSLNQEKPS